MNTRSIDGKTFLRMLCGGAALLAEHVEEINAMNVFPVSDGDTGTNMLKTMEGGISEAEKAASDSIGEIGARFARGVLLAARGNSGVILSQIFAGIGEGLQNIDSADAATLVAAYRLGVKCSYAAVCVPTEGTILTVFRESTESAAKALASDPSIDELLAAHIKEGHLSLERTKELLPVLAEADVVDSGAAGYLCIAVGMLRALGGEASGYVPRSQGVAETCADIELFTRHSVLREGYCTEFLLRLTDEKTDPESFAIDTVIDALCELGGESIVAYLNGDIVKVHVHTKTPGTILDRMQEYGEFLKVKIENMDMGHSDEASRPARPKKAEKNKPRKPYAVVTVATGEGMEALFYQMGADVVISGGQTANPSTEDFVRAIEKCEAPDILVLPNNKNIILAAEQAAKLCTGARVHVLKTKSFPAGYSALSVITPGIKDISALISGAERAAASVIDGEVTRAVRDATVGGRTVKNGEYIALSGGEIVASAESAEDAVLEMLRAADTSLCEVITLFVGSGVDDERRAALTERLKAEYADCEIAVYIGDQEIYDYLLAIE